MKAASLLVALALFAASPLAAQVQPGEKVVVKPGQAPVAVKPGLPPPADIGRPGLQEPFGGKQVVPGGPQDPFAGVFFPPELVMQHQQQLGLTGEQRTAIVNEVVRAQQRFVEGQWQMQAESEALRQLLQGARVDEAKLLQQLDRVLDLERQIKRTQIELQVRIKNVLTEAQQQQLRPQRNGIAPR
jgi:Spy/CpxP family protein refolding chaperone